MPQKKNSKVAKKQSQKEIKVNSDSISISENIGVSKKEIQFDSSNSTNSSNKELRPCKGSMSRIIMDEGIEGLNKYMSERKLNEEKAKNKRREEMSEEFQK